MDAKEPLYKKPTYIHLNSGYFYVNSYEGLSNISKNANKEEVIALILGEQIKKVEKKRFQKFPKLASSIL